MKYKDYPSHEFSSKKSWIRDVRKRWSKFRKSFKSDDCPRIGCAYYPEEVYEWLKKFEEMDAIMREYYKNA